MYIAKVYFNRQLNGVHLYEDYEHFLSDLICKNSELYDHFPEERLTEIRLDRPQLYAEGTDDLGFSLDFEYQYENGLTVYCGTAVTEEELARQDRPV